MRALRSGESIESLGKLVASEGVVGPGKYEVHKPLFAKIYSQVTPETPLHLVLVYPDVNQLSILKQKSLFLHIIEHPLPKTTQYQPTTFILKSLKLVFSTMSRSFSPQRIKR